MRCENPNLQLMSAYILQITQRCGGHTLLSFPEFWVRSRTASSFKESACNHHITRRKHWNTCCPRFTKSDTFKRCVITSGWGRKLSAKLRSNVSCLSLSLVMRAKLSSLYLYSNGHGANHLTVFHSASVSDRWTDWQAHNTSASTANTALPQAVSKWARNKLFCRVIGVVERKYNTGGFATGGFWN